ncbi:PulJ/GspJ family protein [Terrihabitans sp. B22-R8]|uniref:PulJ/GspJ family protein n=1 Tax=Terrihabitans sp. B22-R8 TaxID=3425128 RepID=UPI00403CFA32
MRARAAPDAGFSLIEALVATALMGLVLSGLALLTGQWLPNWQRGLGRVQAGEMAGLAIDRIAADLAAAEFVPAHRETRKPLFEGDERSVTFVRTALGPNDRPGLQIVRLAESDRVRDPGLMRSTAAFVPRDADGPSPGLVAPVEVLKAPMRVLFSYAGRDGVWRSAWREQDALPRAIRLVIRDGRSGRTLGTSTAVTVRAELPADCVADETKEGCGTERRTPDAANGGTSQ